MGEEDPEEDPTEEDPIEEDPEEEDEDPEEAEQDREEEDFFKAELKKIEKEGRVEQEQEPDEEKQEEEKEELAASDSDSDGVGKCRVSCNSNHEKRLKRGRSTRQRRLWSEEDEITILKGMLCYELNHFLLYHEILLALDVVDFSKKQLCYKISKLRKKYERNREKETYGVKLTFPKKPHEEKMFELSKKVWEEEEEEMDG